MSQIFVSYSREDQAYANELADDIRRQGFDVWIDDRIEFGNRWFEEIEAAIIGCDAVVVIMSPPARESKWVQREILIAERDNKPLFPLLLEGREFGNLIDIQFADVRGGNLPQPDFYERLAAVKRPAKQSGKWVSPQGLPARTPPKKRRSPWLTVAALMLLLIAGIIGVIVLRGDGGDDSDGEIAASTTAQEPQTEEAILTPTDTETPAPTRIPEVALALAGVESNNAWTPYVQDVGGFQMALVPAGCFTMGSVSGDADENPTANLCFDAPFWIDVTEVTNRQFGSFGLFRGDNRPRDTITWFEASDFCTDRGGRLPSEAEWEYAAKGPDELVYPWGNDFIAENVIHEASAEGASAEVGTRPEGASWVGALDMSGNLWEWTRSIYRDYPYVTDDGRENTEPSEEAPPALRGGSWISNETRLTSSYRENSRPSYSDEYFGFRCVVNFDG